MMRGDWPAAEEELAWAADELSKLRPPLAGYARARFAQLRRRRQSAITATVQAMAGRVQIKRRHVLDNRNLDRHRRPAAGRQRTHVARESEHC